MFMTPKVFIWGMLLILAITVLTQASTPTIDILESSLNMTIAQGATEQATFTVNNSGTSPLTINISHDLDLIDNDGDKIILTFTNPSPIQPGQAQVTIRADADPRIDFETYQGLVTVKDANSLDQDTLPLTIEVAPDVCDNGEVGNDLILIVEEPDEGDDFEPGDSINVKANVENIGDDDIRTQVEVFLFTDKGQIANAASETKNIENGEEDDFTLSLKIPLDSRKIDEDDDFTLFVKAFDDDQEQLNCVQKNIGIKIELAAHKVVIDPAGTKFLPSVASCGDTVVANVHVVNIGDKDNDRVTIALTNKELGIAKQSDTFKIEAFSAEEDNDETRQFSITIPQDSIAKTYFFTTAVSYEGGTTTEQIPLEVMNCESTESLIREGEILATVAPVQSAFTTKQSSIMSIPVKVKNQLSTRQTFIIALTNIADFAVAAPRTILLNPLQESTLFIDLHINDDAEPGTHTGVIEVRLEGSVVASETVAIEIQEEEAVSPFSSFAGLYSSLPLAVWIIIDLIVIGVLIITVRIVMNNRKH